MATLLLTGVGRAAAGPLGAVVGGTLGQVIDRLAAGGAAPREVGRLGDLTVQSAAYGAPLPVIHGRMRVAGNLIWSSGIDESRARSRGKGRSRATVFSYTASFAIALAGRAIVDIGRIWADGRLLRDADGAFLAPMVMRLHRGGEDQAPDPLIIAAEGLAPAYRGLAYVVFEDFALADWGNRIPNFSFEVIADDGPVDAGTVMVALAARGAGAVASPPLATAGVFPALVGHVAADGGSIADAIAPLLSISDAVTDGESRLIGGGLPAQAVPAADGDAGPAGARRPPEPRREAGRGRDTAAELLFHDVARDYQPGVQRLRVGEGGGLLRLAAPVALAADAAKALAGGVLAARAAARSTATIHLPWRHLGITAGAVLALPGDEGAWRVVARRFEAFVVSLDLVRLGRGQGRPAADAGRLTRFADAAAGPTVLRVLDLPPLPGDPLDSPRLWLAAAGASPGWRLAPLAVSRDGGASFTAVGEIVGGTIMGATATALPAGPIDRWDRHASVDVTLLAPAMWLESADAAMVLAGANLALIGDELVQFAAAEALAPGRFRLSQLLRGRRGTEARVVGHGVGEAFVLLDTAAMLPLDPELDSLGQFWLVRPEGSGDLATPPVPAPVGGAALRPLSPVRVTVTARGDDRLIRWTRRSRAGFGWSDHGDVPLAETREAWRLTLSRDGVRLRDFDLGESQWLYAAAARLADGPAPLTLAIAQLSDRVGPGAATTILL